MIRNKLTELEQQLLQHAVTDSNCNFAAAAELDCLIVVELSQHSMVVFPESERSHAMHTTVCIAS